MRPDNFTLSDSFRCAWKGVRACFSGRNFLIQAVVAAAVFALSIICALSPVEFAVIVVCIVLVLGAEVINTAIETVVDLVSPEYNELAGKAKDMAAGGVLLFALGSFIVGCVIFLPKVLLMFGVC